MTGRWIAAAVVTLVGALVVAWPRATAAQSAPPAASHPVGIRQLEFVDQGRHLALAVFYPAVVRDRAALPLVMPFFDKLKSYLDVEVGTVNSVVIAPDLKRIVVTAQMVPNAAAFLRESTQFWIVKPRIGVGGVSGLGLAVANHLVAHGGKVALFDVNEEKGAAAVASPRRT